MNNEDAIKDIVKETCEGCFYIETCQREDCAFYLAIKALEERPQGEWIKEDNGKTTDVYRCSICGRSIMLCKNADLSKYPFCHCGAEMKGVAE